MDFIEKKNLQKIHDVTIDIDAAKELHGKASKQTLADTYFDHLPPSFKASGAEALYALIKDKDVPASAADAIVSDDGADQTGYNS